MVRKNNVRVVTKFRRSTKAISPVVATLLMIAIAVVASLVVYAWVSGYIGFQTDKAGKAISLPSFTGVATDPAVDPDVGDLVVYVQNVGQGTVEVSAVYVDDVLSSTWVSDPSVISEGSTAEVTITGAFDLTVKHDIKVTTTDGTFMTTSGKPLQGSVSAPVTPFAIVSSFAIADPAESTDYSVAAGSSFTVKAQISVSSGSTSVSADITVPAGYTITTTNPVVHTVGTSDVEFAWTVTAPSSASASAAVTLAASATGYTSDTDNTFNVATDAPPVATKLAFTVHPSTITAGVNTLFTIERQTASGTPTTEGGAITIDLDDGGVYYANFYASASSGTYIYSIILPADSSSVDVYYGYWTGNPLPADLTFTASSTGLTPATANVHVVAP